MVMSEMRTRAGSTTVSRPLPVMLTHDQKFNKPIGLSTHSAHIIQTTKTSRSPNSTHRTQKEHLPSNPSSHFHPPPAPPPAVLRSAIPSSTSAAILKGLESIILATCFTRATPPISPPSPQLSPRSQPTHAYAATKSGHMANLNSCVWMAASVSLLAWERRVCRFDVRFACVVERIWV